MEMPLIQEVLEGVRQELLDSKVVIRLILELLELKMVIHLVIQILLRE